MAIVPHILAPSWRTADFGDGTSPVNFAQALDPGEVKAYTIDCSREIPSSDNKIEVYTITLSALAALAGLRIRDESKDRSTITLWLQIDPADRSKPNWDGAGETHVMTCRIEVTDGQIFERDISITIKQLGQG